jgi:3-methyladenine DNA glycosylase/8-oxoguanine DNA glycosylase
MAALIRDKADFFDDLARQSDGEIMKHLTSLRGIGSWSAKMYLIFVLNRLDILPYEDGAFLQAYKWLYDTEDVKPASIIYQCKPWKPYSSLAARYLYRALDAGMVKAGCFNGLSCWNEWAINSELAKIHGIRRNMANPNPKTR